ncbi:MAG: glycoside hydrolase family 28 protein [Anaeroplasmataceae bacterium]|nr:glycoside hydrolase family 28 protein [Anaeroplasmataceae bacterium]
MKVLSTTSRTITIELNNNEPYYALEEFEIYLNSVFLRKESINVFTIYDLEPNTVYMISVGEEKIKVTTKEESLCLNVREFNAIGDGLADDTVKIQAAIMCCPKNGCVYIPKGTYLITCIFLKSDMMLYFEAGAKIITKYDRMEYPVLPEEKKGFSFGTWEGSMVAGFASSITGIGCNNLCIAGLGEIDEQASLGDWYNNHREKRVAWRGFGMYFKDCINLEVIGIYIHDTPAWNVHPFFSKHLKFLNMRIENPATMPTTDGLDPDCCEDCLIAGCYFSVGDDCIAIKSGAYELAKKYKQPSSYITIRNNYMASGHGGVVFGSESSGGIHHITVEQCIFKNTDRGLRIKTRRGRGRVGSIDHIFFNSILMDGVKTPFVINMFYNMGSAGGHEEYVWSKKLQEVTELTPILGHFKFSNMICKNVGYAAGVFLGLPESPIKGIELENVEFHYDSKCEEGYPVMIEHNFKLKNAGLYCLNVGKMYTKNVTFNGLVGKNIIIEEEE